MQLFCDSPAFKVFVSLCTARLFQGGPRDEAPDVVLVIFTYTTKPHVTIRYITTKIDNNHNMCIIGIPVHDWCDCAKALQHGPPPCGGSRARGPGGSVVFGCGRCSQCGWKPKLRRHVNNREALWDGYTTATGIVMSQCAHHVRLLCESHARIRFATKECQDQMYATLRNARCQPHWIHCEEWFSEGALRGRGEHTCPDTIRRWEKPWEREAYRAVPTAGPCPRCLPVPDLSQGHCLECINRQDPARNKGALHIPTTSRHRALLAPYAAFYGNYKEGTFAPFKVEHITDKRTLQAIAATRARGGSVHIHWDPVADPPQRPIAYLLDEPPSLVMIEDAHTAYAAERKYMPCFRRRPPRRHLYI